MFYLLERKMPIVYGWAYLIEEEGAGHPSKG
jgi:hypothetical protein